MTFIQFVPPIYYNVIQYGAVGNGTTDDTAAINTAITAASNAGGGWVFLPGLHGVSSPLTLPAKVGLLGVGFGAKSTSPTTLNGGLIALAGFSGAEMVNIATADGTAIRDLMFVGGPNSSSASNPAITAAIEVTSSRYPWIQNVHFYYVNGYCIEGIGGASVNNVGAQIQQIHMEHTGGIHWKGVSGSNYVGQAFFSNIHAEAIDSGDALFLEDINDIELSGLNGAVAGGATAGSMLHIKGNCASHFYSNVDLGALSQSTVSPTVLIETSANGSPKNITVSGGIVQKGAVGAQITDGNNIIFKNVTFTSANTDNVQVSGSTVATPIKFQGCTFQSGNQSAGTGYDINLTNSTGFVYVENCTLESTVGVSAGNVTNPANDTNHKGYFFNTHFSGANTTPSNCFSGSPQMIRSCPGYNPRGSITPPAIGASPATISTSQNDVVMLITALNGLTSMTINGTSYATPQANVPYPAPARCNIVFTYTTTPPTILFNAQ